MELRQLWLQPANNSSSYVHDRYQHQHHTGPAAEILSHMSRIADDWCTATLLLYQLWNTYVENNFYTFLHIFNLIITFFCRFTSKNLWWTIPLKHTWKFCIQLMQRVYWVQWRHAREVLSFQQPRFDSNWDRYKSFNYGDWNQTALWLKAARENGFQYVALRDNTDWVKQYMTM